MVDKKLKKLRQEANKKGRQASKYRGWPKHHSHAEKKAAHKIYHRTMERTKCQHWRDWLEKVEDPDIWTAHRYTASPVGDGGKSRIPVLTLTQDGQIITATTNEDKSSMLAKSFFPPKLTDNTPIHFVYPNPYVALIPSQRSKSKHSWQS